MTFVTSFSKRGFLCGFSNDSANVFNGSYYGTRCDISYKMFIFTQMQSYLLAGGILLLQ